MATRYSLGAVPAYLLAQVGGALVGVALANTMFGFPLFFASHHARAGGVQWMSEFVATFGLLVTIWGCARSRPTAAPYAVAAYIVAAYWFTPSTSFANPAATLARAFTDTFAGIRPTGVLPFILTQLAGGFTATAFFAWLVPSLPRRAEAVVVPHSSSEENSDARIPA